MDTFIFISMFSEDKIGSVVKAAGPPACGGPQQLILLLLMFAIFYFLLIRPQQKKAKEHRNMLQNLKKGDRVVTQGGLMGKITGITDKIIVLEIAEKVRVKVLKTQIAGLEASLTGSPEKK